MKQSKKPRWLTPVLAALAAALVPLLLQTNNYYMNIFLLICGYVVLSNGLNILMGYSGQLSLGHAAFYGIGAYVCSILRTNYGVPFLAATAAAVAVCVLFGLILGLPACRQKGIFLALITSGFGTVINLIMRNWTSVTNGSSGFRGIPALSIGGVEFSRLAYCYLYLFIALLVIVITRWIVTSKIGRALVAVRDSEIATEAMGIHVSLYKCLAFAISAAMAGVAGCMYSTYAGYIDPTTFSSNLSITVLAMVILGGMGHLMGGAVGAVFVGVCLELLRSFSDYQQLAYGVLMILVIRFMPDGLVGFFTLLKNLASQAVRGKTIREGGRSA